jgi:hypothetical protein
MLPRTGRSPYRSFSRKAKLQRFHSQPTTLISPTYFFPLPEVESLFHVRSIWIRTGNTKKKKTPQQLTQASSKPHMNWCINGSVVGIFFNARGAFWKGKMFSKMFQVRLVFYFNQSVNFLNRKSDSVVCITTKLRAGRSGESNPGGNDIFRTRPARVLGPTQPPGGKAAGAWR